MTVLSPMIVANAMALAERYLQDTRPVARPAEVVRVGPRAWFVMQTVLHGEDKVAEALGELGYETYAPMMRREIIHNRTRRPVTREFRLFNRYLFAHLPTDFGQWRTVRKIEEIDAVLGDHDGPCTVAEQEIDRFRAAEAARQFDVTKTRTFPVGSRVRVRSGPFYGFSGLVESLPGRGVVKAMLEIFTRAVPVDFPFDMVEPH